MKKENNNFTLEENLALTNDELTSNWTKLASLIMSYEKNISWESARTKAGLLLKDGVAVMYIENARLHPEGLPENKPEIPEPKPKPKATPVIKPKATNTTVYHTNYERLLKIAPGLEEKLLKTDIRKGGELYGKSEVTGYMNFSLELINQDDKSYYIAIAHYHIVQGDMIADPDMVIRVDINKMICEALTFQDAYGYKQVYDDYMIRKLVNKKEQNAQNSFLGTWLRNLKTQGHKIKWKERETTGVLTSELIIQYDKEKEPPVKEVPETAKEPVNETPKVENLPIRYSDEEIEGLISAVRYNELEFEKGIKAEDINAEATANELMRNGEAVHYLLHVIDNMKASFTVDIMVSNYYKVLYLIPDLLQKLTSDEISVLLSASQPANSKKKVENFEVVHSVGEDRYRAFVFQEIDGGNMVIHVNEVSRYIAVKIVTGGFFSEKDYYDENSTQEEQLSINDFFSKWLDSKIRNDFRATWKGETSHEPNTPILDLAIPALSDESAEESENKTEPVEEKKKADEIPDFEPGQVQLVEAHIKAGITQQDIDWINKHQQGMTITPRRKPMINNTKSREMDKAIHAMKPGFRISATGKMYYEGRSNRSDKRNTGL